MPDLNTTTRPPIVKVKNNARADWHAVKKVFFGKTYKIKDALVIGGLVTIGLGMGLLCAGLFLLLDEHADEVN